MGHLLRLTSAVFLGLSLACSGGTGGTGANGGGGNSGNGGGGNSGTGGCEAPYCALKSPGAWTKTKVDSSALDAAGVQGVLLRASDGTLYYAYYQYNSSSPAECDIAVFGDPNTKAPITAHRLKVAILTSGASSWNIETVDLTPMAVPYVTSLYGLDATIDQSGRLVIAFAGGAAGLATCGSSDLVLATRTGANTYTFQTPVADSDACCTYSPSPASTQCIDVNCTAGTDVGAWAAITTQSDGSLAVAHVDYHNFWDEDGQTFQGYEMWHQADGIFGIRPWSGSGIYGDLVEADGTLVSAFANFTGTGIHVYHRINNTASIFSWEATQPTMDYATANSQTPDQWDTDLLETSAIGQRLSMEVAQNGTIGIAAHVISTTDQADLLLCESTDGALNWTCEQVGDYRQSFGYFPSLAYDNENRPVISCRACGISGNCNNDQDGLRLFWREHDGTWNFANVDFNNLTKSGIYTSLVLDPTTNEPTIAYQDRTNGAAMIAQGSF